MKPLYTLFFLMLLSFVSFSQNYQGYVPFPTSDNYWVETYDIEGNLPDTSICLTKQYYFEKDTTINGLQYHKMKMRKANRFGFSGCGPFATAAFTTSTFGYLRNDSINKKVWLRFPSSNTDSLLYDFDLEIGDTLKSSYLMSSSSILIVDSIDTVLINNRYRKKFYLQDVAVNGFIIDSIIEGIGSGSGFAQTIGCGSPLFGSQCALDCVGDNVGAYFPTASAVSCQIPTSLNENGFKNINVQVFPNPTKGDLNIKGDVIIKGITVYNHQGQIVQTINPSIKNWELPNVNGLYYIRLEDEKGNFYTKKIIKN